ncbi:hypothetical protein [Promicromonospora soli]|uniref:Sporulation protein YtfJ n=1 Tax=Promicromonospora soli TaxID=2035533 RepID=A0A919KW50_9MICO|nr:hypothetical protein [Promicromonospora soli]GHH74021.1 hypothetical protein GCM10017772_26630 [Promicromonospora soli]
MRHIPDLGRISEAVAESFGVRHVYGETIERDGVLVVPAARVWSSGGAGAGGPELGAGPAAPEGPADRAELGAGAEPDVPADGGGGGVGFGRMAEPAGAFVVDERGVRWVPAVNVNRIVLGGQVAFVLAAAVVGWAVAHRRRG